MNTKSIRRIVGLVFMVLVLSLVAFRPASSQESPTLADPSPFCVSVIDNATHHLGDTPVPGWDVVNPEGIVWSKTFSSPTSDHVILRFETFEANDVTIRVNGQRLQNISGEPAEWRFHAIFVEKHLLLQEGNKIRFEAGGGADKDDSMFRNLAVVNCYSILEVTPHHIGNTSQDHWLIESPESVNWTMQFGLTESLPGTSLLALDIFDNTSAAEILINGTKVGTVQNGVPETWKTQTVVVDGSLLDPTTNTITINPGQVTGSDGPWDDFIFKNIRLYYETRPTSLVFLPHIDN